MPERVLLQPSRLEYGVHREQYAALVKDLEAAGVLVRVLPAVEVEERGLPPGLAEPGEVYELVIQVGKVAGTVISTSTLIEVVRRRLRGQRKWGIPPRRAQLYFANGEEHEFNLDAENEGQ